MRIGKLVGAAVAAIAIAACSQSHAQEAGPGTDRQYQVGAFERLEVAGPYEVEVRTGSAPSVSASGPQAVIDRLVVEVEGGTLKIHPREENDLNFRRTEGTARVLVTVPMVREASIAGSGGIRIDRVAGDRFAGNVAGSGDLTLDSLEVQSLKLAIAGSGDVTARAGQSRTADYSIAGSGGIGASGVRTESTSISIAGSGSVQGQATGSADVSIMGSGDVELTGGAKCNVSKMGSGDVRCS